jgi:hypothetical protein
VEDRTDAVIQMIVGSAAPEKNTTIGRSLIECANSIKNREIIDEEDDLDDDIKNRIFELSDCEKRSDLIWMDYYSWNQTPILLREMIENELNPLFWSGVFFEYSKYINYKDKFKKLIDDRVIICVVKGFNYRMYCFDYTRTKTDFNTYCRSADYSEIIEVLKNNGKSHTI